MPLRQRDGGEGGYKDGSPPCKTEPQDAADHLQQRPGRRQGTGGRRREQGNGTLGLRAHK